MAVQDRLDVAGAIRRLLPEWLCWVLYAGTLGSWALPVMVAWSHWDEPFSSYVPVRGDGGVWERLRVILGQGAWQIVPMLALMMCIALCGQSAHARATGRPRAGAVAGLTVSALLAGVTGFAVLVGPAELEGLPEEADTSYRLSLLVNQAPSLVLLGAVLWGFGVLVLGRLPFVAVAEAVGDQSDSAPDPPPDPTPAAEPAPPDPNEVVAPIPLQPAVAEPPAPSGASADTAADPYVAYRRPQPPGSSSA